MTVVPQWEVEGGTALDVIQQIVDANDWAFERPNDEELAVQLPGRWSDFNFYASWDQELSAMQFTMSLHMRVPAARRSAVHELLALANEKVWMGHFAVWHDEGWLVYRHALPFRDCPGPSFAQMQDLIETAIAECERFYPAFQYVIWAGKPAEEALAAAMIETQGEA